MDVSPEAVNFQKALDLQTENSMIYAVAGAINTELYTDLLEYKKVNNLSYRLSLQSELGKFVDYFYKDFLFIGKNNKIIGSLSYLADVSEIDAMIKRTAASFFNLYLKDHQKYFMLKDQVNVIDISDFFVNGGDHQIEYSVIGSSDPSVCSYEVAGGRLILYKGDSQGNSDLTLQAKITGRDLWIRTHLYAINNTSVSVLEDLEYDFVEDSPVSWIHGGDINWSITSDTAFSGYKSLRSGVIGDGQSSEISLNILLDSPGVVSFAYKTDSYCSFSPEISEGDFLNFYINDINISMHENRELWGGMNDWRMVSYTLNKGNHSLKWEFLKNEWGLSEEDAVWVDYILLPGEILKDSNAGSYAEDFDVEIFPNPFNPETQINFSLEKKEFVKISLFDANGRFVKEIFEGSLNSGAHSFFFSAENLSTGIYFTVFKTDKVMKSNKIMLIK